MSVLPPPPPEHVPPPPPPPAFAPPPPGYQAYDAPQGHKPLAGLGARFAALLIDSLIVTAFFIPGWVALLAGPTELEACSVDSSGTITVDGTLNAVCEVPTNGTWAVAVGMWIAAFVGGLYYYAMMEGKSGQTVGKKALGIRVVDPVTGGPIGVGRGIGRYFARMISAIPFYLGYLWAIWDPKKQAWHDKMVNDLVVKD
jgi:uncharacterized RDD family membrane protein YckC